jgi:hypothetical protein
MEKNGFVRPDALKEEFEIKVVKIIEDKPQEKKSCPCPSYITQYYG